MKFLVFICFLPTILSSIKRDVTINYDDDCWSMEKNNTIDKTHASLVKFSPNIDFRNVDCSVRFNNPWVINEQNGFGVFLPRIMDCSSQLIIDCLPEKQYSMQLTCHTSDTQLEVPCSSMNLIFRRNIRYQQLRKPTFVQVVALAKGPCVDYEDRFRCPNDYPESCIDSSLLCNGRSECPHGGDERDCHPPSAPGMSILVIILIVLGCVSLICVISTIVICCCCYQTCKKCIPFFRRRKSQSNATVTGENDKFIISTESVDTQRPTTSDVLTTNPVNPIYPQLKSDLEP